MFHNTSGVMLLAAMAQASSYAQPVPALLARTHEGLLRAGDDIRLARVELYCDHRGMAIAAIRRATHAIEDASRYENGVTLAALEQAIWEARRDHTGAAVAALDDAIVRLAA